MSWIMTISPGLVACMPRAPVVIIRCDELVAVSGAQERDTDLGLDGWNDGAECVAAIRFPMQGFDVGDELPASRVVQRGGDGTLRPNLQGLCALSLPMHSSFGACRPEGLCR